MKLSKLKSKMPEKRQMDKEAELDLAELELGDEEEDMAMEGEEEEMEMEDSPLADLSDEELMAEIRKRGLMSQMEEEPDFLS